jgi:hypothetical protein
MARFYTQDAKLLAEYTELIQGRAAIERARAAHATRTINLHKVTSSGDLGLRAKHRRGADAALSPARRRMPVPADAAGGRLSPRSPGAPGPARPPCRQNRTGSLSAVSSDSQATGRLPDGAQPASSAVLPDPAGAQTRISRRASPSPSASASRGRGTSPGRGRGTCSLVAARTSCPDTAAPRGAAADGSAISDPPPAQPATASLAAR